jgi:hypothetical protein
MPLLSFGVRYTNDLKNNNKKRSIKNQKYLFTNNNKNTISIFLNYFTPELFYSNGKILKNYINNVNSLNYYKFKQAV